MEQVRPHGSLRRAAHDGKSAPWQFVRFCLAGAANTLTALAIYAALLALGVSYLAAVPIAYAVGTAQGYVVHRHWTFRSRARGSAAEGVARYSLLQLGGLGANVLLVFVLVRFFQLPHIAAQAVALSIVVASTFLASRTWVFRAPRRAFS